MYQNTRNIKFNILRQKVNKNNKYLNGVGCLIVMDKEKDFSPADYQDFATFELFSMINNSEYKDRLPKTLESLGLNQTEAVSIYNKVADGRLDRFDTFIEFMRDFGVQESKALVEMSRDEKGNMVLESLALLLDDALNRFIDEPITTQRATIETLGTFELRNLRGRKIFEDYKRFEELMIKTSEKELREGISSVIDGPAKVKEKLDDIFGLLIDHAIPRYYKEKKNRAEAASYFR